RPGRLEDLDRADHPYGILEVDSWFRVDAQQPLSKGRHVEPGELRSARGVGWDAGQAESVADGIDVKHRPTLDDGELAARGDVVDGSARPDNVLGGIEIGGRVDEVDHVIPHAPSLLVAGLVGRDVEALIDLPRVGDHDLSVEPQRELEGELRFPDPGGSDDDRDSGHRCASPPHSWGGGRGGGLSSFSGSGGSAPATRPEGGWDGRADT